jgi:leucyl aminopeptidase (aminopeptidase T)
MQNLLSAAGMTADDGIAAAAKVAVEKSLGLRAGETLLIVTNPEREVLELAFAVYDAAAAVGASASLIVQGAKSQTDYADEAVISAFDSKPDAFVSLSSQKLGKDRGGIATPYDWNGTDYDHIFHYQLRGARTLRAFWSPSVTRAMFAKTVPIDYGELGRRCAAVAAALEGASSVRITNPGGTDIRIGLAGRKPRLDDGDFSKPGSGGNLPAGEVFVSPALGSSEGLIAFDGSIAAVAGCILIREPIRCRVQAGFVTSIEGGSEAAALRAAIAEGEEAARRLERSGSLPPEKAEAYARNARAIGELGIGLNPKAEVVGNMLEDEKAFRTCHFAIGSNYDEDGPALIHLDGLVSRPTIVAVKPDGRETVIERDGELAV